MRSRQAAPQHILAGDLVKIARSCESFWLIVEKVNGHQLTAVVDNHLYYTDLHGLRFGDRVTFNRSDVLDWMRGRTVH